MAAPAIGRRSPLVSAFFCPSFSFSFFRSLRPGTLHKPFQYIFIYFSLPSPRLLEQLLAPRQPKSQLRQSSLVGHFLGRPITFLQPPSYTPIIPLFAGPSLLTQCWRSASGPSCGRRGGTNLLIRFPKLPPLQLRSHTAPPGPQSQPWFPCTTLITLGRHGPFFL